MVDKKSLDFLPKVFQTNTNRRFLNATVDQLIQEPNLGKVYGYIGRQDLSPAYQAGDSYVHEDDSYSQFYQLEPGLVINKRVAGTKSLKKENAYNYVDLLNSIALEGGINTNHSRLFANEYYNFEGFVELDKLINYGKYYWMPNGPVTLDVNGGGAALNDDFQVTRPLETDVISTTLINKNIGQLGYKVDAFPNRVNPTITLVRGGVYTFNLSQLGHPFWIQTEPGLDPGTSYQDNIIKRDVFGVVGNGTEVGSVTFNVPSQDSQYFFENMPVFENVDLVSDIPFNEMQNAIYDAFVQEYNLDGLTSFAAKTIVLTNDQDDYWFEPDNYDDPLRPYDSDLFDRGINVSTEKRRGIWQIANVDGKVRLTYVKDWPANTKIFVKEGDSYGHIYIFKDTLLNIYKVPTITAPRNVLYYQDGVDANVYGEIRLVDPDPGSVINLTDIVGRPEYKSPNGVQFTNGLKVKLSGLIEPIEYAEKEFIVEGVGKSIVLVPWESLVTPDPNNPNQGDGFSADGETFDSLNYDLTLNAPQRKDYVVINRASRDGNAWSRTNRWFHEDVIRYATTFVDPYAAVVLDNAQRGIRPIIEFDANLQLWNHGNKLIKPVTVIDAYMTDISNEVEGRSPYVLTYSNKAVTINKYVSAETLVGGETPYVLTLDSVVGLDIDMRVVGVNIPNNTVITSIDLAESSVTLNNRVSNDIIVGSFITFNGNYLSDNVPLEDGTFVIFTKEKYDNTKNKIYQVQNIRPHSGDDIQKAVTAYANINSTKLKFGTVNDLFVNMKVTGTNIPANTVIMDINSTLGYITVNNPIPAEISRGSVITFSNSTKQVHLIPIHTMAQGESVLAVSGVDRQNQNYWWNNSDWQVAQQKFSLNQNPLFDVFNLDGISWGDTAYYPSSSFVGSKLFGYKEGIGTRDKELGFPLSYRSIGNIGDIVFENFYDTDTFRFNFDNRDQGLAVSKGYVHELTIDGFRLRNNWVKIADLSKQYIQRRFEIAANKLNNFPLNISFKNSFYEKNLFVFVNGVELPRTSFVLVGAADPTVKASELRLNADLAVGDILVIKMFGDPAFNKEDFTLPKNLSDNSENDTFATLTLGQIRNHLQEIAINSLDFLGESSGNNNLRDIEYKNIPGKILQHSAGVHTAQLMFNNETTNIIEAIDFSRRSYARFKDRLFYLLSTMEFADTSDSRACLDTIMEEITINSSEEQSFYYTDMLPYGKNTYLSNDYIIYDTNYRNFNLITPYNINLPTYRSVLVYLNGQQQLIDRDYTVTGAVVTLTAGLDLAINDKVTIIEYDSTAGCMIPATPTKMGLYPKFTPALYADDTYIGTIKNMIQGHDGSKIVAFGDYRDAIILEFEKRIYNNLNVAFSNDERTCYTGVEPGAFRNTDYSMDEWTQLLSRSYLSWAGSANVNIFLNDITQNDPFSFNYGQGFDKLNNEGIPGYWRGIYKYFFDTDRPHTHPWEMFGFSEKPDWWELRYGAAPYTSGNLVLWKDVELGVVYRRGYDSYLDTRYARPGVLSILPVDVHGTLLPPVSTIVTNWRQSTAGATWRFGDQSPQETAWRRSSDYPFAVQIAWALARPAQYCNLSLNRRDLIRLEGLDQIINKRTGNRKLELLISDATQYIPGSNVWVRDRLADLGLDITENFADIFADFKINLVYKTAGYTDKSYLQIIADQASPSSTNSGVLVPQENYEVLLTKSAPVSAASYSAVIVEKSQVGFAVYGFDIDKPYFTIIPRRYNSNFYNVTVSESTAIIYNDDENFPQVIPYGTQLSTRQQVVDFLISYGKHLTSIGFQFIDTTTVENVTTVSNWNTAVKEFLYWIEQGWADHNTVISLTPAGTKINFDAGYGVVDPITSSFNGSRVLDSDGNILTSKDYTTYRSGTEFELILKDQNKGIHLIDINVVQYEHTLVFDNTTVFNDVIYQPNLGNRQYRMKVSGVKTRDWDGSLYAPGFMINHKSVDQWIPMKDYYKGDVVLYKNLYYTSRQFNPGNPKFVDNQWYQINGDLLNKQLIPNMAFGAQQFEHFYDVDQFDVNRTADMAARNSTGFTRRKYLSDIGLDDISQHKFYLGMIREKGTQAAVNAFLRTKLPYLDNNIQIDEQWAVRLGNYGGVDLKQDIELSLSGAKSSNGTYVIELLNQSDSTSNEWNSFRPQDLLIKPTGYDANIFAATEKNPLAVATAGPVLVSDVSSTVFNIQKIYNINSLVNILGEGNRIWVAADAGNNWNVFRMTAEENISLVQAVVIGQEIEFTTNKPHKLRVADHVMLKNAKIGNGKTNLSGFYRITAALNNVFRVPVYPNTTSGSGAIQTGNVMFKLKTARYGDKATFAIDTPSRGWIEGDKVWIDNNDNYQVLTNNSKWDYKQALTPVFAVESDKFGSGIDMKNSQDIMVVGAPNKDSVYQVNSIEYFVGDGVNVAFELAYDVINTSVYVDSILLEESTDYSISGSTLTFVLPPNINSRVVVKQSDYISKGYLYVYQVNSNDTWGVISGLASDDVYAKGFGSSVKYNDLDWSVVGAPNSLSNNGLAYIVQTTNEFVGIKQVLNSSIIIRSAAGVSGEDTVTVNNSAGLHVGMIVTGDIGLGGTNYTTSITDIDGTTITLADANADDIDSPDSKLTFISEQPYEFGAAVAASSDGKWIAVSATGIDKVYIYQLNQVTKATNTYTVAGSSLFAIPTSASGLGLLAEDFTVRLNGKTLVSNIDYTLGTEYVNGTPTADIIKILSPDLAAGQTVEVVYQDWYKYVVEISNDQSGSKFGYSITLSDSGNQLVVGAPLLNRTIDGVTYINMGQVYVYDRSIETFIATGTTNAFVLDNEPKGYTVIVNGELTSDYTVGGTTLTLDSIPSKNSIVTVETNNFSLLETKNALVGQDNLRFGAKVLLCPTTCSLYVGATGYNNSSAGNGAVFRFANSAKLYGIIITNTLVASSAIGDSIRINNVKVTLTGVTAESAASNINSANIPGVYASAPYNNTNLLLIKSDNQIAYNKLVIGQSNNNANAKLGLNIFDFHQLIVSNSDQYTADFGNQIYINRSADTILVGASIASNKKIKDFDSGTTYFDSKTTKFADVYYRSGAAYLYEYQSSTNESPSSHGNFAFAQVMTTNSLTTNDYFSTGITLSKNWIMITALNSRNSAGTVYSYHNATGESTWQITRSKPTQVDTRKIERLYLYNDNTKTLIGDLPVIDPEHGMPVPSAVEQIRYTVNYDPAVYTTAPNSYSFAISERNSWGKEHVGELWWDTNAIKYTDWNQGTVLERLNTWGLAFPNSYVNIYEWIETDKTPSQYATLNPQSAPLYSTEVYSFKTLVDFQTLQPVTKYYFWVRNSNANPSMKRRDTALALQTLIANPRNANEPFAAIIGSNALALFNCQNIVDNDTRLHISLKKGATNNPIHEEWSMFDDGSDLGVAIEFLERLNDSLSGEDLQGRNVPDQNLTLKERYGLNVRPRQTTFVDKFSARQVWVDNVNAVMLRYPMTLLRDISVLQKYDPLPVVDGLEYTDNNPSFDEIGLSIKFQVDTNLDLEYYNKDFYHTRESSLAPGTRALCMHDTTTGGWTVRELIVDPADANNQIWNIVKVQTYDVRNYWSYTDWYATQYSAATPITKILDYEYEVASANLQIGDVVKIKNSSDGNWKLILVKDTSLELIGQQNATVQFNTKLYNNTAGGFGIDTQSFETKSFAVDAALEFRKIFEAVNFNLFINELRTDYKNIIKLMIDDIATQFKQNDWLLKTSLINVNHRIRSLDQIPVYVKQPENIVIEFISEVKPFHTKIKQYISKYDKIDLAGLDVVDFDLPAYFNSSIAKYRQPQLGNPVDDAVIGNAIYQPWFLNHTYSIDYVDVFAGGQDYTSDTTVVIEGDGTGATARAFVRAGAVTAIEIENPGYGYTRATVRIIGTGRGATAYAKLTRGTARTFATTVKFDRFTYASIAEDWQPNTSYGLSDLVIYNHAVYRPALNVIDTINDQLTSTTASSFVSGDTFSMENYAPRSSLVELNVRLWEPFKTYSRNTIIVYNRVAYVALTDFTSSRYFEYNTGVSTTNSVEWQAGVIYTADTIISYNGSAYKVISNYTSPVSFDEGNLIRVYDIANYPGGYFDDAASRVWSYYDPAAGMPGRDLAQVMAGIEYPGVSVMGANFDQAPGFGFGLYEQITYDTRTYDENGLIDIYGDQAIDSKISSMYKDLQLGLRPEDMINDGAGYVDTNSSHAPEELIPGHMFDSLEIKVKSLSDRSISGSPDLVMISHYADNFSSRFSFDPAETGTLLPRSGVESLVVISDLEGFKFEGKHYTINWQDQYIEFFDIPQTPGTVFITAIGSSGQNVVSDSELVGDGTQTEFKISDVTLNNVQQAYVKVNGEVSSDWSLIKGQNTRSWLPNTQYLRDDIIVYNGVSYRAESDFVSVAEFNRDYLVASNDVVIRFDQAPAADARIQIHLFDIPLTKKAYSQIINQRYTVAAGYVPSSLGYVIDAPEAVQYKQPWEAVVTIAVNGSMIEPSNQAYYTADGITKTYSLPQNKNIADISAISAMDVIVVIDGKTNVNLIDYTISNNGVDIPTVTFANSPKAGANIVVSNRSEADFVIYDENSIIIKPSFALQSGDEIYVSVYSNHDAYDVRTEVFSGLPTEVVTEELGFDNSPTGFDNQGFENEKSTGLVTPTFTLSRPVNNLSNIIVTLNGQWLDPFYDFVLITPTKLRVDPALNPTANDIVVVRHYSEATRLKDVEYIMFKGITETYEYFGVSKNTTTTLAEDLLIDDKWIYVDNINVFSQPDPGRSTPGVVFVNGERITFYILDQLNKRLGQLRRATNGTGAPLVHDMGSKVYDAGYQAEIPNSRDTYTPAGIEGTTTKTDVTAVVNSEILYMADTDNIYINMLVIGANIPDGTKVIGIEEGSAVRINKAITSDIVDATVKFKGIIPSSTTSLVGPTGNIVSVPAGSVIRQGRIWYDLGVSSATNGTGLGNSNTQQANFLKAL